MSITRTLSLVAALALLLVGTQSTTSSPHTVSAAMTISSSASASGPVKIVANRALDDSRQANEVLAELAAKYRYLDGATVSAGSTPNGEQAVAFYTEGRILISPTHTVGVKVILAHEIWHVIDWRDNGRLDWGENLPPRNAATYVR